MKKSSGRSVRITINTEELKVLNEAFDALCSLSLITGNEIAEEEFNKFEPHMNSLFKKIMKAKEKQRSNQTALTFKSLRFTVNED